MRNLPEELKAFPGEMQKWIAQNGAEDPGNTGFEKGWANPEFDDSTWKDIEIPSQVGRLGLKGGGIIWYRKSFVLPQSAAEKPFDFDFGWLNDGAVTVYFNGVELKATATHENFSRIQLRFHVDKSLIRPGNPNTLAVRLHALTQGTNWGQPARRMGLPVEKTTALDNNWKFQVEKEFPPLVPAAIAALPATPAASIQSTSSALFNAMINPLIPYAFRGSVWYQGESNTGSPEMALNYRKLLPALIEDWALALGRRQLPILYSPTRQLRSCSGATLGKQLGYPARISKCRRRQRAELRCRGDD